MSEDQGLFDVIDIQFCRGEQHIVVAGEIPPTPEQHIRLTQRRRQLETQPRLGSVEIGFRPSITASQSGAGPVSGEALDEGPCVTAAFHASGERRDKIEPLCHARTISVPLTGRLGTGSSAHPPSLHIARR
ncbi:hypothetical protein [Streptomyces sp. NPDC004267]|uniref:hypothetical protein n=1 Tax=Streptomyces sp. NPDC004267 TaxID=3364694 RepID=UPI00369E9FC0